MQYGVLTALLALAVLLACVAAVDRSKFRSCKDTGFCRVFRAKSGPIFGDSVSRSSPICAFAVLSPCFRR